MHRVYAGGRRAAPARARPTQPARRFRRAAAKLALVLALCGGSALPAGAEETSAAAPADEEAIRGKGARFSLRFDVERLEALGVPRRALAELGPASVSGMLVVGREGYALRELEVRLGPNHLSGSGTLRLDGPRLQARVSLDAVRLDLRPFQERPEEAAPATENGPEATPATETDSEEAAPAAEKDPEQAAPAAESTPETDGNGRLIPDAALPVAALRGAQADIHVRLHAERIQLRGGEFRAVDARLRLEQGRLTVEHLRAQALGGELRAALDWNARERPAVMALRARLAQFEPARLAALAGVREPPVQGAVSDLEIELRGAGDDLRTLAGSLDGRVLLASGKGRIQNNLTDLVGASLLYTLAQTLNPFASEDPATKLQCAVAHFTLEEGVARAERGLAMETRKVNVIGSGLVDLRTERIDFGAKPKAKQGLGINVASLTDFIRVGGTLANPRPATDPVGLFGKAGSIGAAIFTGGLSLLAQSLYGRLTAEDEPCQAALKPPGERGGGGLVGGAASGAKGALGRLFGGGDGDEEGQEREAGSGKTPGFGEP